MAHLVAVQKATLVIGRKNEEGEELTEEMMVEGPTFFRTAMKEFITSSMDAELTLETGEGYRIILLYQNGMMFAGAEELLEG